MKTNRLILLGATFICLPALLTSCGNSDKKTNTVEIKNNVSDTHYLKFIENNSEVLRLVVLEGETYEDLLPYFPTLTEEPGFIKYWDGDYTYTSYSHENQFKVWSSSDLVVDIYAYSKKA